MEEWTLVHGGRLPGMSSSETAELRRPPSWQSDASPLNLLAGHEEEEGQLVKRAAAANKRCELTVEGRTWQSVVDVPLQGEGDEVRLRAGQTLRLEALAAW